jgi:hypothetical protein
VERSQYWDRLRVEGGERGWHTVFGGEVEESGRGRHGVFLLKVGR